MATRAQRRAQTVPELAQLARSRDFRTAFAEACGKPGRQITIIPTLSDDRMGYVLDRLREAGNVGVVALVDGDKWKIALMWPASAARMAVAEEDDGLMQVHDESRVEMFFEYLLRARGNVVVRQVTARLVDVDQGEHQSI